MEDTILKCNNIYKKIGKRNIINGISLEIKKGEIVGFIGPNGAGKTTTIKLILGLQKLTKGSVEINGYDINQNFIKAIERVGAIIENPDLYMYMSGYENLKVAKNYYDNIEENRINEVLKIVGLDNRKKDKVSKYSLGMKQRLGIAEAILHNPNLLILDEPTNGLDPEGIIELRNLFRKLAHECNIGIFISSHNLNELENICDRIYIIKNGTIVEETNIEKIKNDIEESYILEVNNSANIKNLIENKCIVLNVNNIKIYANKLELPEITKKLEKNGIVIYTISKNNITLEDAFIKKIGGNNIE